MIRHRLPTPGRLPGAALALLLVALLVGACATANWPTPNASVPVASSAPASPGRTGEPSEAPGASQTPTPGPPATPSNGATGDVAAEQRVYAEIAAETEQIRGLKPTTAIVPQMLTTDQLREWLTKEAEGFPHEALAADSRLLIHLGLLPEGSSLEKLELDLQSGQVAGLYDPKSKKLYVVSLSGGVGVLEKITFTHEYTHALQDQHFGLARVRPDVPDQSDATIARTSLPEGDATLEMTEWAKTNLSYEEILGLAGTDLGAQQAQLDSAPAILRTQMMFPYEEGLVFVSQAYRTGGWTAVNALYSNPPVSTSQILHPELYRQGVKPVTVSVPVAPSSWKTSFADTFGELELRVWLEGEKPDAGRSAEAADAVATWAGDRVALYEGPNGAWAVVMRTKWRTTDGATKFNDAAKAALARIGGPTSACKNGTMVNLVLASDDASIGPFGGC